MRIKGHNSRVVSVRRRSLWGTLAYVGIVLSPIVGTRTLAYAQQPAASAPLVFDGVTVVDVQQGRLLPAQRVVVEGNHIRAVGSAGSIRTPAGAHVVNAQGKYLIPGLWDMHTHSRRATDQCYPLFIVNGVTGMRDGWSEVPLDTLLLWQRQILAGTRVGPPRQLLAGPALDEGEPSLGHIGVADSVRARHIVDSLKSAGASYIKTYALGRALYFVVANEARRVGIPFGGHLPSATVLEAADSGARFVDHVQPSGGIDTLCLGGPPSTLARCQLVAERFRRHDTWWVPTLSRRWLGDNRTSPPQPLAATQDLLSQFVAMTGGGGPLPRGNWLRDSAGSVASAGTAPSETPANTTGLLHLAHQAGLPILAGTDASMSVMDVEPMGASLHLELAIYVAEGLTPLEALQAATLNPAKMLHATDSLGTVAPGKLADLVLLDANPLQDITNSTTIRAVVANGRYYDRTTLDQLAATAQANGKGVP